MEGNIYKRFEKEKEEAESNIEALEQDAQKPEGERSLIGEWRDKLLGRERRKVQGAEAGLENLQNASNDEENMEKMKGVQ